MLENEINDTETEVLEYFYHANFSNEKFIIWLMRSCRNLKTINLINFPENGEIF